MSNRLADQTSPYLRQHADNPVDWWPWCTEALERARAEDKPILLSVGYSACHWCHVMAHESFEDEATAALMNARFVNIKVDREERPDLDKIYQLAHQIMTQRAGGWPLTVVLDPNSHAPFMAGTYFPRQSAHGLPAFADMLSQVADWYAGNSHRLADQKQRLDDVFARLEPAGANLPDARAITAAAEQLAANFDTEYGGFTGAPKFPHPASLALAQRLAARGDAKAGNMARFSLERMAAGGLFDHLGGGFFRYSVDPRWEIPHFEKMLYDNGALLSLYARAADHPSCSEAAQATAAWVLAQMRAPGGGFYSSLDADSDGGEGRFYIWDADTVKRILGDDFTLFASAYGLDRPPNFEGAWHLQRRADIEQPALQKRLAAARRRLLQARARRKRPGLDDKILTAWNALTVKGLADAARRLQRDDYADAARTALDFLHERLWQNGRLLAVHAGDRSHTPAFLDDYAFVLDALLANLQANWHTPDLRWACALAEALLTHFEDPDHGGFFFTADDHEQLLHRPKPLGDEATPSGNGVAAQALLRLGWLVGEPRYLVAAERTLTAAGDTIARFPLAHASLICALDDYLNPPPTIILRGDPQALESWANCARTAAPLASVYAIPAAADDLPTGLADKRPRGDAVAYVCHATTCSAPITELEMLEQTL